MQLFVFCLFATVVVVLSADVFQQFDKNADGVIDRPEFKYYLNSLHKVMDPLVDGSSVSTDPDVVGAIADQGGDKEFVRKVLSMTNEGDFVSSFCNSLAVILVTEIGDKTFFIAAVLAMRNGRFVVYTGAMCKLEKLSRNVCEMLTLMPILSCMQWRWV